MIKVHINYFGIFKKFGDTATIESAKGSSIEEIKNALILCLGPQNKILVEESVIADETDILPSDFTVNSDTVLSILPPVCGG